MKITIKREEFLKIVSNYLPEDINIGDLPWIKGESTPAPSTQEYSDMFQVLSKTEWKIFCEITNTGSADVPTLAKHLRESRTGAMNGPAVANHIKGIRRKIVEWKLPYQIDTKKVGMDQGMYFLRKI